MKGGIARIVAALSCVLAFQVGATAAAAESDSAPAGEGKAGRVVFECDGRAHFSKPLPRGHCTVSGVITDRGRFADDAPLGVNPHVRIFFGTKGTIEMNVYLERGHWEVSTGSRAYRGLRGRGWQTQPYVRPAPPLLLLLHDARDCLEVAARPSSFLTPTIARFRPGTVRRSVPAYCRFDDPSGEINDPLRGRGCGGLKRWVRRQG